MAYWQCHENEFESKDTRRKIFGCYAFLLFSALKIQLVVLVSAFVMVNTF